MALKGSLTSTDYNGRSVVFEWTATQNISKNQSTVKWTLKGAGSASGYYISGPFYVKVNGVEKSSSTRINLYAGTTALSDEITITHGDTGAKKFDVEIKAAIWSYDYNCSGSKTFTLDTIPRKATISSAPNFNDEGSPKISYNNPAGSKVDSLKVAIYRGSDTALVDYKTISSPKTSGDYTFSFSSTEKKKLQDACSESNSVYVRFYIRTQIGDYVDTHYVAKTLTIKDGSATLSPTVEDSNAKTIALTGDKNKLVKYYSNAKFDNGEAGRKGSTIKSRKVVCGSKSSTSATGTFSAVESGKFSFTATDSRQNDLSKDITKTMVNYVKLTCSMSANAEVVPSNNTATINLSISGNYFNGSFGAVSNSLTVWYRIKEKGKSWSSSNSDWTTISATKSGNTYTASKTIPGLDYQKKYTVQAIARDKLWEQYSNYQKSSEIEVSAQPVFDYGEEDFTFNVPVNFKGDEWHDLEWSSDFSNYNDNTIYRPQYKVCGNVVYVQGIAKANSTLTTSTSSSLTLATGIPAPYRPAYAQHCVCQGSGMNRWLLTVGNGGTLLLSRYGTTEAGSVGTGSWLPFSFAYMI